MECGVLGIQDRWTEEDAGCLVAGRLHFAWTFSWFGIGLLYWTSISRLVKLTSPVAIRSFWSIYLMHSKRLRYSYLSLFHDFHIGCLVFKSTWLLTEYKECEISRKLDTWLSPWISKFHTNHQQVNNHYTYLNFNSLAYAVVGFLILQASALPILVSPSNHGASVESSTGAVRTYYQAADGSIVEINPNFPASSGYSTSVIIPFGIAKPNTPLAAISWGSFDEVNFPFFLFLILVVSSYIISAKMLIKIPPL